MRFTPLSRDQSLRFACTPRSDSADPVRPLARGAQLLHGRLSFPFADHCDHADAAVEDTEHLLIRHPALLLQPGE
jgi:hypothetical protein